MASIDLSKRATKDLKRIGADTNRTRIVGGLRDLAEGAPNLDVDAITGHPPWLRLRVGDFRVLYRPIETGWWVERIVNRRDLLDAVKTLG